MPVVQDQNRILDALQGAVSWNISEAIKTSGTIQEANDSPIVAMIGSLAGGAAAKTTNSNVERRFTLFSNAGLVFALLGGVALFFFLRS